MLRTEIKVGEEKTDEGTEDIRVTLKELIDATGKFSKEKKIGDGSLGTVYKVKRLFLFILYNFG